MQKNRRIEILIIRLSAMGDVAIMIPVIEQLKAQYGDDIVINVLTQGFLTPLFSHIETINVQNTWNINSEGKFKDIFKVFWRIYRSKKHDVVIDLHDVIRTKILRLLFKLCGVKVVTIDKGRESKKELVKGIEKHQLKSSYMRYIDTFDRAGIKIDSSIKPAPTKRNIPQPILDSIGEKQGRWLGIAPFAMHKGKTYPLHLIEKTLDILYKEYNDLTLFIFSGGADELERAKALASKYPRAITVFDKLRLNDELNLMANLECIITMDSSSMHFASAVALRVISIWGATHPYAGFLGYNQSYDDVVQIEDMECRPCSIFGDKPCYKVGDREYECMQKILPDSVANRVKTILDKIDN